MSVQLAIGGRGVMGLGLGRSSVGAAAETSWWLAGGISAANCVAAYQPKGAASLAASYTNLANPGTYDAAPGVAPTWASGTGWTGDGTRWLDTGVTWGSAAWSALVRYSGAVSQWLMGADNSSSVTRVGILPNNVTVETRWCNTAEKTGSYVGATGGVIGFAGSTAYFNGSSIAGAIPAGTAPTPTIAIMAIRRAAGPVAIYTGNIQAVAIYNTTLTAPQVAAVSAAMAAL